jgi:O-antigen/teichoic acid export membrane protein
VAAAAGLGIGFAAPVAIDVVAGGGEFDGAVGVLELQAIAFAGTFPAAVAGFAVLAQGRYRAVLVANGVALAVSLTMTLVIASAQGAAMANIAGELALLGGYVVALRSGPAQLPLRLGLMPRVWLAAGLGTVAGVVAPGPSLARTAIALTIFGLALTVLRGVPDEIRQALLRRA